MAIQFEEHKIEIEGMLNDAAIAFLYEAAGELEAQVKRNLGTYTGDWFTQQKNSWKYSVDEAKGIATIGNPLESSLWTEFGTGEYAQHHDGRKGYWIYVKNGNTKSSNPKTYTREEARKMVAMMRKDGIDAHYTNGQKPKKPFQMAFASKKDAIIKRLGKILGETFQ